MSFYTGTQVELLYCQPANGTAVTAAAQTVLTGMPAASNPPYQLPAYFFPSGQAGIGKHLRITAGGFFSTGTITTLTYACALSFDTTKGTHGTDVAKTGAVPVNTTPAMTSITNGAWYLDCLITCQQVGTTMNLNALGTLDLGAANNATTTVNLGLMIGAPNSSIALDNSVAYFPELWWTWSVTTGAPTVTCSQFNIYGCN